MRQRRHRRLPHILLNAATVVSALLFTGTLALTVISVWGCHRWTIDHRTVTNGAILIRQVQVAGDGARLWFAWDRTTSTDPLYLNLQGGQEGWRLFYSVLPPDDLGWRTLWFGIDTDRVGPEAQQPFLSDRAVVHIPAWVPLLLSAVFPLRRLARLRKERPGLCRSCGYDLRATPDRCPECGAVPPPPLPPPPSA